MFEYMMPALWMRSYPDTLVTRTLDGVVAIQQAYAKAHGDIPWGISECGYSQKDDSGHYHYQALGIPAIALKWDATAGPVVSPYSTFLALGMNAGAAMKNLSRMAKMGWIGAFGFYEAADYSYDPNDPGRQAAQGADPGPRVDGAPSRYVTARDPEPASRQHGAGVVPRKP